MFPVSDFKKSEYMRQQQLRKPNCKTCGSEKLKALYKKTPAHLSLAKYIWINEMQNNVQVVQINLARYDICEEWEGARELLSSQRERERERMLNIEFYLETRKQTYQYSK
jgi:hypothetical protein